MVVPHWPGQVSAPVALSRVRAPVPWAALHDDAARSLPSPVLVLRQDMIPDLVSLVQTRLNWGRDRAVTIGELAETMNLSRRAVEKAIETLRATGAPVCSGPDGIWLTTSEAELLEQYRALRRRYLHQAVNARHLLRTARRYARNRQATLWSDVA